MKKSSTLTLTCFTIASLALAGCGDDESTPQECTGEDCGDQPEVCDPACAEGDVCKEGHCYTCSSSGKCYLNDVVVEKTCENSDECGAYEICENHKCIPDPNPDRCDPECTDGQICQDGTCVDATLLWTLCQSDSDCGITNGTCTFTVAPSKPMFYKGKKYGNGENIPVSLLDERINTENYNATHKFAAAATSTIGICTQNCSIKNECEEGFTCQLVAEADPIYPTDAQLPVDLPQDDLAKPGFAAICRRVMNERLAQDMPYNAEFCHQDEDKCKAAGGVFVDGMCLDKCDPADNRCPYTFSCEEVDGQNVCMPNTHTCTACHDEDKDGYGYGHCVQQGIDCDDANPDVHYNRTMTCDEVADKTPTDLNCNGLIDYFEMVGTPDNCNACGDTCYANRSDNTRVACIPSNGVKIDEDWRKTASFENTTKLPDFTCVLTCDFGWGNCYDTDKPNGCETQLYNDRNNATTLYASAVNGNATVWGADNDRDGYISIDTAKSKEMGEVILDSDNTLLCCNTDSENKCYEANAGWKAVTRPSNFVQAENVKSPSSYDANDNASTVNPDESEHCDGLDNDGSLMFAKTSGLPDCKSYCANKDIDCVSMKIEVNGKYEFNPYCDATVDGSAETTPWYDTAEAQSSNKGLRFGETCAKRHETNEICDANAIVSCTNMQEVRCYPDTDHCACSYNAELDAVTVVNELGSVQPVLGQAGKKCLCDGTDTDQECTIQCNLLCVKTFEEGENSYALACMPNRNKQNTPESGEETPTTIVHDGRDDKGNYVFNGLDENCNGIPDDEALVPCIITLPESAAPYQFIDTDGIEKGFVNGVTNEDSSRYKIFDNTTAEAYQKALKDVANADGSINLCRLGWLQPNKRVVEDADTGVSRVEYGPNLCVPLYKPRDVDFLGDGIDSNCDGVDYDINNVVYVTTSSIQLAGEDGPCSDPSKQNCTCNDSLRPCNDLQNAIDLSKDNRNFFKDILILTDEPVEIDKALQIPISDKSNLLTGKDLKPTYINNYSGSEKEHILSAYQFHRELIQHKLDGEKIDDYTYGYENETIIVSVGAPVYEYSHANNYEIRIPKEQVRIFGGLSRENWSADKGRPGWIKNHRWLMKDTTDISNNARSSIEYPVKDLTAAKDQLTYSMIEPADEHKLSLGLYNLDLNMSTSKETPKNKRDGITFTGINGYLGVDLLTFVNTQLSVSAPNGYSFKDYELDDKKFYEGTNTDDLTFSVSVNKLRPPQEYNGGYDTNVYGDPLGEDLRRTPSSNYCKLGIEDVDTSDEGVTTANNQTYAGGQGGQAEHKGLVNKSINGSSGTNAKTYLNQDITNSGGKGSNDTETNQTIGNPATSSLALGDQLKGKYGEFTGSHPFAWIPETVGNALYINSDRRGGRGYYGGIGGGGGGGTPKQCNMLNDGFLYCFGGNGGTGGCGGIGGEAGGTGGSALGIVMSSDSVTTHTTLNFDEKSKLIVHNGVGGDSQVGALGQPGGMGGSCHNVNLFHKITNTSCGGGGGAGGMGGAGAAGRVGWPFPLVLICNAENQTLSDYTVSKQASDCGFDIPSYILDAGKESANMSIEYQKASYDNCESKSPFTIKLPQTFMMPINNIVDIPLTPTENFDIDHLTRDIGTCEDTYLNNIVNINYSIDFCSNGKSGKDRSGEESNCQGETYYSLSDYYNENTFICSPDAATPGNDERQEDKTMIASDYEWNVQFVKTLNKSDIGTNSTSGTRYTPTFHE